MENTDIENIKNDIKNLKTDIKNLTLEGLEAYISGLGKERFRAKQIFKWLYQMDATSFSEMTNVSKEFRSALDASALISNLEPRSLRRRGTGPRSTCFASRMGAPSRAC